MKEVLIIIGNKLSSAEPQKIELTESTPNNQT